MAKKQTRRTISVNRSVYETALKEAQRRKLTLAGLVEAGFAALGIPIAEHPRQPAALARKNTRARQRARKPVEVSPPPLPSRERQVLGEAVADAYGFQ